MHICIFAYVLIFIGFLHNFLWSFDMFLESVKETLFFLKVTLFPYQILTMFLLLVFAITKHDLIEGNGAPQET